VRDIRHDPEWAVCLTRGFLLDEKRRAAKSGMQPICGRRAISKRILKVHREAKIKK
jgi:hypothetical protein